MGRQVSKAPRKQYFLEDPDDLTIVGLDTKDGPEHPLYDKRIKFPVDANMAKNIAAIGIKQPIVVRKNGPYIEVVDGRQRVRAAREANIDLEVEGKEKVRVPCVYVKGTEADLFGILVSNNEHRRDDSPLGKAEKCKRYLAMGRTEEEAAIIFGVSKQTIKNWLSLFDLAPAVRKAVDAEQISASAASGLVKLEQAEQESKLKELLAESQKTGKRPTRRNTDNAAGAKSSAPSKRVLKKLLADEELAQELEDVLGSNAIVILSWVTGETSPTQIKGLTKLLRKAEGA